MTTIFLRASMVWQERINLPDYSDAGFVGAYVFNSTYTKVRVFKKRT